MLPKINRLNKDKEFDYVFKAGRSGYDKISGVKAAANKMGINRFGILVSGKISKKAVLRNKIKRRIRDVIRSQMPKIKAGYDIVVISLPGIKEKAQKEIKESVINNLKHVGLFLK